MDLLHPLVCKFLTVEMQEALERTGRSKEVLELGEVETRLTEAVDNICERILQYSVHGTSQTMTTLKNLLWDQPSAEVTDMKKQCETMLEQYEDVVEDWYFHHQDQRLENFLCEKHILKMSEQSDKYKERADNAEWNQKTEFFHQATNHHVCEEVTEVLKVHPERELEQLAYFDF
uniref:Canopy FGF signaling regulator 4 n=1 Tax=Gouania willdenowi TaxID=441366 RepID=A0A8C5N707_GOUWI